MASKFVDFLANMTTANNAYQMCHVLLACWLVEHVGKWTGHIWYVVIGVLVLAAVKEFYYDANFEDVITRGSDLEDFSFYCLGAIIGVILTIKGL